MGTLRRNTQALFISSLVGAALSFVLSVLIGRGFGQSGLGVYSTALAWIGMVWLMAEFGVGTLLTREWIADPEREAKHLAGVIWLRVWLGGGLSLAFIVISPLISSESEVIRALIASAPLIAIQPLFGTFSTVYRVRQAMWPIPWLNIGMLAVQVAVTGLVIAGGGDVLAAVAVNTLTSAGQLVAAWWVWKRWFQSDSPVESERLRRRQAVDLLRRAWPFAAAGLIAVISMRLPMILMERLGGLSQAGDLAAVLRFMEAGRMLPNALFGALLPMVMMLETETGQVHRTLQRSAAALGIYGIGFAVALSVLGGMLIEVTFGGAFAGAQAALSLAGWALVPSLLKGLLTLYWYAKGREQMTNVISLLGLGILASTAAVLIPQHGAVGAAGAIFIAEAAAMVMMAGAVVWRRKTETDSHGGKHGETGLVS
ncbi:MAG: oligosaccharide flippase family protein [Anaerolineae bacterium]|nr:oligosaccharide flippase family protein [Anaerolineae bacterium]